MSKIFECFLDKAKTITGYPKTLTKAVYDDNGNRLDNTLTALNENLGSKATQIEIDNKLYIQSMVTEGTALQLYDDGSNIQLYSNYGTPKMLNLSALNANFNNRMIVRNINFVDTDTWSEIGNKIYALMNQIDLTQYNFIFIKFIETNGCVTTYYFESKEANGDYYFGRMFGHKINHKSILLLAKENNSQLSTGTLLNDNTNITDYSNNVIGNAFTSGKIYAYK